MTRQDALDAAVAAHDKCPLPGCTVEHQTPLWRSVHVAGWPTEVHYEYRPKAPNRIAVELHVGGRGADVVADALRRSFAELRELLPNVEWDPTFGVGKACLGVSFPISAPPDQVADGMRVLFTATRLLVSAELRRHGLLAPAIPSTEAVVETYSSSPSASS